MAPAARRLLLAAFLVLAGGIGAPSLAERRPGPTDAPEGRWAQQHHLLPVQGADGATRLILARTCRPPGGGARRLVVISHGKSSNAAENAAFKPPACAAEPVRWFLDRGFAVILPVRRGYGGTGGAMAERHPACSATRDYAQSAQETARDIAAAITYATALPGIAPNRVVLVGQSAGGLGTIALSARNDSRISALVNMAGGDGGHLNRVPHAVCHPEALVRAAARFGAVARTPMLWVYTANDSYFSPEIAGAMHQAYVAGGGKAQLASLSAWGSDGHRLFNGDGGSAVWGSHVESFLGLTRR